MKKRNHFVKLIVSLMLISVLAEDCNEMISYLFIRTPVTMRKLEFFWKAHPQQCIMLALYAVLILIAIVSFLGLFKKGNTDLSAAPIRTAEKKTSAKGTPRDHDDAEEAIHCAHLTGRAKYLEQIDNYLRTGLIDRNEYRVLKNRYMNIDISDDYH